MDKQSTVNHILKNISYNAICDEAYAFAPTNLALCKYWGKRDFELNLPVTSSLSITLENKGAFTSIKYAPPKSKQDIYIVNGIKINSTIQFAINLQKFLNLFRPNSNTYYQITTDLNIPIAAGLASSACGFAALTQALNNFYNWRLDKQNLSVLARLGSGSACRSFWKGFVEWQVGSESNGMDSFAKPFEYVWPDLRIGILNLSSSSKSVSSREAMEITKQTSPLYSMWPEQVAIDLENLKLSIIEKDFDLFGRTAEANATMMHEMILTSTPSIQYSLPETYVAIEQIYKLRRAGAQVFFTQDAGPNLCLLFLAQDQNCIEEFFPNISVVNPFTSIIATEHVVLVDANDQAISGLEKIQAHLEGHLHRAFSVLVLRSNGDDIEILLQKRNFEKYHCGGLWSNACCGHPRPNEDVIKAAQRRLNEELGLQISLESIGSFTYQANLDNGLKEHEIDHVFVGIINSEIPIPNPMEICATRWISISALQEELIDTPNEFTPWLNQVLSLLINKLTK